MTAKVRAVAAPPSVPAFVATDSEPSQPKDAIVIVAMRVVRVVRILIPRERLNMPISSYFPCKDA
jgi:hypothetical protein